MTHEHAINGVWRPMWAIYVVVPLAAGLDKFTNLLVDWTQYIAPVAQRLLPVDGQTFMYIVGVIEIAVGVLALTRYRRLAAYVAAAWLVLIAINLLAAGYYDVAVRDVAMAVGAFTLGQLLGLRGEPVPGHARGDHATVSASHATSGMA